MPILKYALVLLVEVYLKLVLDYFREIDHYKVDFYNVHIKLCGVYTKVNTIFK